MLEVTNKFLQDAKADYYNPSLLEYVKEFFIPHTYMECDRGLLLAEVKLVDISFYQRYADFNKMKSNGVNGAIIRAGQNLWADTCAEKFMSDAEKIEFPVGSYWFYDSRVEPKRQAETWKKVLGNHETQLMCWADYEETYGGRYTGWKGFYDFLEACKALMPNRKFGIYTGYYYWLSHSPTTTEQLSYFAKYPLWLAWYTNDVTKVKIPRPWTKLVMWQKSASGNGYDCGVGSKEIDMDSFLGTMDDFNDFFGLSEQTPTEPPVDEPEPPTIPEPPTPTPTTTRVRIVWDDENPDLGYKSRTQSKGWKGPKNPPAVYRFYPEMRKQSGDYRVNMEKPHNWKSAIIKVNGGSVQKFNYLTGPKRATYNKRGWPQQAYITMSGNVLEGEFIGDWFKFKTLKQSDVSKASDMTQKSNPEFVHNFTCVTWDKKTGTTKRIPSTGTPRGQVYYFLVTKEGVAYIEKKFVKQI